MASPGMQPLILDYGVDSAHEEEDLTGPQQCLLCKERFDLSDEHVDTFLRHLLEAHKLVIGDVERVANLERYVEYWRPRLEGTPLECVCVKMEDKSPEDGPKYYFMLCSILQEDKQLRSKLQRVKLQQVLDMQQKEREDNSKVWKCLFCNESFIGNRSLVLNHMNIDHSFNIGHPDNLVNVESFLAKLHNSLERLLCLYCERTFKDKFTLKEHMRKKFHKKLNPNNKEYDEYYLVNYLELGKDSESTKKVMTRRGKGGVVAYITSAGADSDGEEGWQEGDDAGLGLQSRSVCLYCKHAASEPSLIFAHMSEVHNFDIASLTKEFRLNFYHLVKIVNYIRRQVLERRCVKCQEECEHQAALLHHMTESRHITEFVEERQNWDQPEYYFPTYENDNLLSGLDCEEDTNLAEDWVIPEESPSIISTQDPRFAPIIQVPKH